MPREATPHDIADYLIGGYNDNTNIPYTYFDPNARGPIKADIGCRVALNCEMGNPTKSTAELCP